MMKSIMNWSGGKDSALALYKIQKEQNSNVKYLFTTISKENKRISMHGVHNDLLKLQAKSLGMQLIEAELPEKCPIEVYSSIIGGFMKGFQGEGITTSIFGDIFLEDLREYREKQLESMSMHALFPLWKRSTKVIAKEFIDLGFKTIITCIDSSKLDASFVGRIYDESFLNDLPSNVDPCGENGEFHSFVFDGPNFEFPIKFKKEEKVYKTYPKHGKDQEGEDYGFWYMNILGENE